MILPHPRPLFLGMLNLLKQFFLLKLFSQKLPVKNQLLLILGFHPYSKFTTLPCHSFHHLQVPLPPIPSPPVTRSTSLLLRPPSHQKYQSLLTPCKPEPKTISVNQLRNSIFTPTYHHPQSQNPPHQPRHLNILNGVKQCLKNTMLLFAMGHGI